MDADLIRRGLDTLANRDTQVADGLAVVGYPEPRIRAEGFPGLLAIITAQQISASAAAAIRGRLQAIADPMTPEAFLALDDDALRAAGLSRQKVAYARGVAEAVIDGRLKPARIAGLSDDEVIETLAGLKGIGRWSAEIYMLFSLGRSDIFPADDLAIQEALRRLKKLEDRPKPVEARALVEHWAPWRGVGALFLWHYYKGAP